MFTEFEFEDDRKDYIGKPIEVVTIRGIKGTKKKHEEGYDFISPLNPAKKYRCVCTICDVHMFTLDFLEQGEDRLISKDFCCDIFGRLSFTCSKQCHDLFVLTPLEI